MPLATSFGQGSNCSRSLNLGGGEGPENLEMLISKSENACRVEP